jgi:hypothetical protein
VAITAASVESNGWVLRLDVTGSLTSPVTNFGAYPLTPDATPKVALAVTSPGFVKSGGTAVSGSTARSLVGTRALRLPVDPLNPTVQALDETDLGGGVIRIRIALSEEVYVGDNTLTLAVLAGWRTGESAASGISVTNNSTVAPPVPVFRWVLPPYETTTGTFRASIIVGTVNPVGFEPVAGVKFTAHDGTTTKTIWATELGTDNTFGDNLRCYTVEFDPAAATALTAGLLRIDAEVYPWVGAMRTTDPAGTKSMTTLRTAGYGAAAENPWVIGYDPSGVRYGQQWAFVDPVNGTTTAAAGMIATTLAGAKAVAPASRPANVSVAVQALYLANRTLAAANGQAAQTRSGDGARIVLATGTHTGFGTQAATSGFATAEIPIRVIGDPDDSNPRANCIVNTSGAAPNIRTTRLRVQNCTVQTNSSSSLTTGLTYLFLDNVLVQGASSFESSTTWPLATTAPAAGQGNVFLTNSRIWRLGVAAYSGNRLISLARDTEHSRQYQGLCFVKNRWIGKTEDGFNAANAAEGYATFGTTDLTRLEDIVVAYNDVRFLRWDFFTPAYAPSAISGVSPQLGRYRRYLVLNNVVERISGTAGVTPTTDKFFGIGEGFYSVIDNIIIEGNTFAGSNYNAFYCDPTPATVSDINTQTNIAVRIRHANNAADRNASKHDDFNDPTTSSVRAAAGAPESLKLGYRPACIDAWRTHYGVGMEGHIDFSRKGSVNFRRDGGSGFVGLRGVQYPFGSPGDPLYTNDKSEAGDDLGGGDYTPQAGSPVLGRTRTGNSDRDFAGNTRVFNGAAGAIEGPSGGLVLTFNGGAVVSAGTWGLAPLKLLIFGGGDVVADGQWTVTIPAASVFSGPRRFFSSGLKESQIVKFTGTVIR